jgi:hypothetical protein
MFDRAPLENRRQLFIIYKDFDFIIVPSLGFQVQIDDYKYPIRSFASLVSAFQKDTQVVEFNMPFEIQERCIAKIKIVDQKGDYNYSITVAYINQSLVSLKRYLHIEQ